MLKNSLIQFLKDGLTFLQSKFPPKTRPMEVYINSKFTDSSWEGDYMFRVDAHRVFTNYHSDIGQLPSIEPLIRICPVRNYNWTRNHVVGIVDYYIKNTRSIHCDKYKIEKIAQLYIDAWNSGKIITETTCLLTGIRIKKARHNYDYEVSINSFTNRSKSIFWNYSDQRFLRIRPEDLMGVGALLKAEIAIDIEKFYRRSLGPDVMYPGSDKISRAMTAMRLGSGLNIGYNHSQLLQQPQPNWAMGGWYGPGREWEVPNYVTPIVTTEKDLKRITTLFEELDPIKTSSLELALRRYNLSFNKVLDDDAIIDLAISMESSLTKGTRHGITSTLQLRSANLIGKSIKDIQKSILELYKIRNSMVHEGFTLKDALVKQHIAKSTKDYLLEARELVRQILLAYINLIDTTGDTIEVINSKIDSDNIAKIIT